MNPERVPQRGELVPLAMLMWKRAIASGSYYVDDEAARMLLSCVPEPLEYMEEWFDDSELRTHAGRALRRVAKV